MAIESNNKRGRNAKFSRALTFDVYAILNSQLFLQSGQQTESTERRNATSRSQLKKPRKQHFYYIFFLFYLK